MLLTSELLDATLVCLVDAHNAATSVPVVLPAGVMLGAPLISLVDVRDVVLLTVVRLDAKMVVRGVPYAGVLLDALLVHLVDVRDVVLVDVVLSDVVMLVPDAVLTVVLLDALLVSPMGVRDVARRRGACIRRAARGCAARRTARRPHGRSGRGAVPRT